MKKIALLLVVVFAAAALFGCAGNEKKTLYVLNWGDYIDEALLDRFEQETGIDVNYTTMASNEEMLIKLQSKDTIYDICFPSDYIVERLISEGLLHELNKDNIPNLKNIDPKFLNLSFDPGNKYSVPYMWGTVGIMYNKTMVKEPVTSWNILWDKDYSGQIFMYDSIRDTIGLTLKKLGYSINTRDEAQILEAQEALIAQKPLVKAYLGDAIKDSMIAGEGALSVVYSGDAVWCTDAEEGNPDLAYAVPEEGSNIWFDNIIIPKASDNTEAAEAFINFLCDAEVAKQNTEYIGYSTPNAEALKMMDPEWQNNEIYNPPADVIERCEVFHDLGDFTEVYSKAWDKIIY